MIRGFKLSHENRRDAAVILKLLSPVLFLAFIGTYFHAFVVHAVEANMAINAGIVLAASYGVILITIRLVNAQIDFRVIERFGREASQGVYMKTLLDEPWLKRRYVRHYLSHIANTGGTLASQMDQNAIENELHALQVEYDSKLELPQFLVGFMIAMGLLGTFIGLLETLTGISSMLDGLGGSGANVEAQFMQLIGELRKPLAGMGIAFSASMFGLITSLMLAIMMTNLRRYINRVMSVARNVMHDLTEMSRTSGSSSAARHLSPADIAAMAFETPTEPSHEGGVSNTILAGRFDVLSKKIELLLGAVESSAANMQKMTDLLGFGPRMKEIGERTLDELKTISARHAESQNLMRTMIDTQSGFVQTAAAQLETQRQSVSLSEEAVNALKNLTLGVAEQHQITHRLVELSDSTTRILGGILESQKQVRESTDQVRFETSTLATGLSDQRRLTQTLVDVETRTEQAVDGVLDTQRQFRSEIAGSVQTLVERLAKVEEAGIGSSRHMWEIKENFIKLCKSLGVVDLIASGISGQALLLETLVEETRSSRKALESSLQDSKIQGEG